MQAGVARCGVVVCVAVAVAQAAAAPGEYEEPWQGGVDPATAHLAAPSFGVHIPRTEGSDPNTDSIVRTDASGGVHRGPGVGMEVADGLTACAGPACAATAAAAPTTTESVEGAAEAAINDGNGNDDSANPATTLRIIHITDVYTLQNFPSLANLIQEQRAELESRQPGSRTISVLTGDFLMPYLLSTVDHGKGMMKMLNAVPIDYLTWGNHEHDMPHEHVMAREREYRGLWLNANMRDHESVATSRSQLPSATVTVRSADGTNSRAVGMVAVLSDEASLYSPNAFGGATITDPYAALAEHKARLEAEGVDLVVPLCHLYEWQDEKTASLFDFPVILSGHDHHVVDRVINGSRLLKPGQDAVKATVIDLSWADGHDATAAVVAARHLTVADYVPNTTLAAVAADAYAALNPIRQTQLAVIPGQFRPLTSRNPREGRVSMATFLCTVMRDALSAIGPGVDAVIIQGGFFKASLDYPDDAVFNLEMVRGELMSGQGFLVCTLTGRVLRNALRESWRRPNPGWMQADAGVVVDADGFVVSIGGEPLDLDRLYRIGSYKELRRLRDAGVVAEYFESHPEHWPARTTGRSAEEWIMEFMAFKAWGDLRERFGARVDITHVVDADSDGTIDPEEQADIKGAVQESLGLETHADEHAFAAAIGRVALGRRADAL